jgi:KUP system potassium uptake protein
MLNWSLLIAIGITFFFLMIDLGYLSANFLKILRGGWVPLLVAAFIYLLMSTWQKGRNLVRIKIGEVSTSLEKFVSSLKEKDFERVKGTAIYLYINSTHVPPALEHNLKHN